MICKKCGQVSPQDSQFCEMCGAALGIELPKKDVVVEQPKQQISPGVVMGADGVMRWVYEMNMWKNPTLIITIWKVLLLAALVPALLVFFLNLGDGIGSAFLAFFKVIAIVAGIVTVLMLLAYPLVAIMNGGKYCVMFEMDDKSVKHIQMQKQFKKNLILAMIVSLAGMMSGNAQTAGAGLLAGSKQSTLSRFEKVKSITVNEKRHVIYLNENLTKNQIYADTVDFAFISKAIISRCKKAKVTYK
ncbi:MAG: zinc ribbon domain-containing protein [Anaerolineaceae bacterium]|nr:zinc ribbon domain-containing protein [Anaerolineaceae bacterium]